jgi:hypothetical protein
VIGVDINIKDEAALASWLEQLTRETVGDTPADARHKWYHEDRQELVDYSDAVKRSDVTDQLQPEEAPDAPDHSAAPCAFDCS